jgi:hypothetical protein
MKYCISSIFFLYIQFAFAQIQTTAGGFAMRHYGVKSYGTHPRNFYITQDDRDMMYFGNAYGVLEFDGKNWRNIGLSNGNSGLSLLFTKDKRLMVGSLNELGYLKSNLVGRLEYASLTTKLPKSNRLFGPFHGIYEHQDDIIYHSNSGLYIYKKDKFSCVPASSMQHCIEYVKKIGDDLYVQEIGTGLTKFDKRHMTLVNAGQLWKDEAIIELLPYQQKQLLVLNKLGLHIFDFRTNTPLNDITNQVLKQQKLSHAHYLQNGNIIVSTLNNGLYILNKEGVIIQHISSANGLVNNSIHYTYTDHRGGLWLAQDNGITYLEINTPFSYLSQANGIDGMGYTATIFQGKLYLGTSLGLYVANLGEEKFRKVSGIGGQIWHLQVIENTLLCCQNEHVYQIKGEKANLVVGPFDEEGNWKFIPLKHRKGYALKGTYLGFQLYQNVNGNWRYIRKLSGFEESSRVFVEDEPGVLWMCHGNKGMYRIEIADDFTHIRKADNYNELKGLSPTFFCDVTNINNQIVFSGATGTYTFDHVSANFTVLKSLNRLIGSDLFINRIFQYPDGNIWICAGQELRMFPNPASNIKPNLNNPFKKLTGQMVGSYEFLMPIGKQKSIIGSQDGFILYDMANLPNTNSKFNVVVRKVEANFDSDSVLFAGDSRVNYQHQWSYDLNKLRFTFSALFYENPETIKFQYALCKKGQQEILWSTWTNNTEVDFSNLFEGQYEFRVRAKNIYEEISNVEVFTFEILPPWYRTFWAYFFYGIMLMVVLYLLYSYIKSTLAKQKIKLTNEKEKELLLLEQKHINQNLQLEKELITLRNEKLEADVILKNNELASLATTLTQKTEFLSHLKEKLADLNKDAEHTDSKVFKEVIKTIDQDLDFDDNWARFQKHFDELHHNFLHRLRDQFPKLNPSWLLICAYIRLNKSNKEIASLMNITVSGVEKRKFRLREKLELSEDVKLGDFIANY